MATSCTVDFKDVTAASFNGTNLSAIYWCDTATSCCSKVWPIVTCVTVPFAYYKYGYNVSSTSIGPNSSITFDGLTITTDSRCITINGTITTCNKYTYNGYTPNISICSVDVNLCNISIENKCGTSTTAVNCNYVTTCSVDSTNHIISYTTTYNNFIICSNCNNSSWCICDGLVDILNRYIITVNGVSCTINNNIFDAKQYCTICFE